MKWVRGDIAFIYNGDAGPDADLAVLDNQVHHHPFRHHSFRASCCTVTWVYTVYFSQFMILDEMGKNKKLNGNFFYSF